MTRLFGDYGGVGSDYRSTYRMGLLTAMLSFILFARGLLNHSPPGLHVITDIVNITTRINYKITIDTYSIFKEGKAKVKKLNFSGHNFIAKSFVHMENEAMLVMKIK